MDNIKVCALGGLDENGRDCYLIEINDDIFVIDAGTTLPDKNVPGVDYLIPNFEYIVANKNRIKAYIISHGHDENMAALKYFYDFAPAPIYCTYATRQYLKSQCRLLGIKEQFVFELVNPSDKKVIAGREINFFQTCHNFSQSFGVAISTDKGNIVYSGDFIIDFSVKNDNFKFDLSMLGRIAEKPTLLLMTESKGARKEGYCSPKHRIYHQVKNIFKDSGKRIFISCYWENLFRITEIINLCRETGRKLFFYNAYTKIVMNELLKIDQSLISPTEIIDDQDLLRVRKEETVILILGQDSDLFDEINKLALGASDDKRIILTPDDIFISSAIARPSLEMVQTRSIDNLYRAGCRVIWLKGKDVIPMHAQEDDLKLFLSLLKPQYYLPIRGDFVSMMANARLALNCGVGLNHNRVFVIDNGMQLAFSDTGRVNIIPNEINKINVTPILVAGRGVSHIGEEIIEDRKKLGVDGVVVVAANVSCTKRAITSGPDCQMRGFVHVKEAEPLLKYVMNTFSDEINNAFLKDNYPNFEQLKKAIADRIYYFIRRETGREPFILPIIIVEK